MKDLFRLLKRRIPCMNQYRNAFYKHSLYFPTSTTRIYMGQLIVDQHVHIFGISLQPQLLAFGQLNTQRNLVTFLPSCGVFGRVVACSLPICDSFVQTCCQFERTCSKYIKIFPNDLLGPAWKIPACRPWHSWSAKFLIFLIFNFTFIKIKMYQNRNCIKFTKVKNK